MELDLNLDSFTFNENLIYVGRGLSFTSDSVLRALEALCRVAETAGVTLNYDTDENSLVVSEQQVEIVASTELDKFLSEFRITKEQEVC